MKQAYKLAALLVGLLLLVGFNVYYFVLRAPPQKITAPDSMARRPDSGGAAGSLQSKNARSRRRGTAKKFQAGEVTPANAEKPGLAASMGLGALISASRPEWQAAEQPGQVAEGRDSKARPEPARPDEENESESGTAIAMEADTAKPDASEQDAASSKQIAFGAKTEVKTGDHVLLRTPLMYDWEAKYGNADLQSELEGQADSPIADRVSFTGLAMTEARGAMRAVALINGSFYREGDEIEMGLILQRIDPRGGKIQVSDGKELAVISLASLFVGDSGGGEGGVDVRRGSDNEFGQGAGGEGRRSRSSSGEGRGGGGGEGRGSRSSSRGGSRRGSMGDADGGGRGRGRSSRGERGGSEGNRGGSSNIPRPNQRRSSESGGRGEQSGGAR